MMASLRVGLETALKVDRGRPAAHAKLVDFALLGIVGFLVLLVIALSAFMAFFENLVDRVTETLEIDGFVSFLFKDGLQLLLVALLVLGLYRFVPARKLRTRGALAGAILTTVLIWGATKVLAILFADFSRYNVIYGSLAGVMTFLFYVYVVALVVLLGAEFAHAWSQGPGPPGPPMGLASSDSSAGSSSTDEEPPASGKPQTRGD